MASSTGTFRRTSQINASTGGAGARTRPLPKVLRPNEIPIEECGRSRKKDLTKAAGPGLSTLEASIHILPPGGSSDPHRHMAEEIVYVLEGSGYDLHWDGAEAPHGGARPGPAGQPTRYEWNQGDTIYVPVNVSHQHFNQDIDRPARLISAMSLMPNCSRFDRLEESPPVSAG